MTLRTAPRKDHHYGARDALEASGIDEVPFDEEPDAPFDPITPGPAPTVSAADDTPARPTGTGPARPALADGPTAKQVAFIRTLTAERGNLGADDVLAGLRTKRDASRAIERLLATPKKARPAPAVPTAPVLPDVPEGHYAIVSTGDNDLAFYRVDRPADGAYAGRTFVKLVVGGHPDRNVARAAVPGILARIAADPDAAARYGREIGRCYRCNRHLTDETSRALGIGPDCRTR